jgi:hypothetical protein
MTHLEKLRAQIRRLWIVFALGFITIPVGSALFPRTWAPVLAGFAIFGAGILLLQWMPRCPRCGARLGHVLLAVSGIRFCPYCGLDTPVNEPVVSER